MSSNSNCPPLSVDDIYAMVDASGKGPPNTASWGTFLAATLVGVPLYIGFIIPGVALTMMVKGVLGLVFPKPKHQILAPIDNGIKEPDELIARSERTYDVVVLGATGFTGKLAAEHLAREYRGKQVKWAIAGRSQSKLDAVKKEISRLIDNDDETLLSDIPTILVDTTNQPERTLPSLVKDTRCVITTVGPFEKYGSSVVEACAKYGTHYVDTTGEVGWVNTMQLAWQETAQRTGAKIVSFCAFDSIPSDMSTMQLDRFLEERGEALTEAELLYDNVIGVSGGTMATMEHGFSGQARQDPKHSDFDANYRLADGTESQAKTDIKMSLIPSTTGWSGRYSGWTKSFSILSLVNGRVVQRSHAIRNHYKHKQQEQLPPLIYKELEVIKDFKTGFVNIMGLSLLFGFLAIPPTKALLSRVIPKQGEGPTREEMFNTFYCALSSQGIGSKGTKVRSVLYYDKCVGYYNAAKMVAESGLCLALAENNSYKKKTSLASGDIGGFFTPSTGLGLALMDRLIASKTCYFAMEEVKE